MSHSDASATLEPGLPAANEQAISPSSQLVEKQGTSDAESPAAREVLTRLAGFPQLNPSAVVPAAGTPIDFLLDVTVTMSAELGHTTLSLGDILKLGIGSVVELDRFVGEPVDLSVKGVLLARGEVVVVEDRFAVRVKEIMKPKQGPGEKRT